MTMPRILTALIALMLASAGWCQVYPSRPVRIVLGFAPGGAPDTVLRLLASRLEPRLGQTVVVENRPGASGTIGAASVARAEPDGHTLLFGVAANLAVAPATMRNPPYDPTKAFTPIIEIASGPYVWLVRADAPARTMAEFVAWSNANKGGLNYGTPGLGSAHHLFTRSMLKANDLDLVHVPYKSGFTQGLLSGEVQAIFDSMPGPLALIHAGKLRALGVTGDRRLAGMPDVPTLREQGIRKADGVFWWGVVGPAGMRPEVVARLNTDIAATLSDPEVAARFREWRIEASGGTPEAFSSRIGSEYAQWRTLFAESGLPPE